MDLYVIRRRRAFQPATVEAAVERANAQADEARDQLRHVRSYLLAEEDGSLGTVCLYEATGPEAIRAHATAAGLPADEILRVVDTGVTRPDPEPATPQAS
ncbi:MAG: nickel-binding protein [Acidimicrobiia bacterium]